MMRRATIVMAPLLLALGWAQPTSAQTYFAVATGEQSNGVSIAKFHTCQMFGTELMVHFRINLFLDGDVESSQVMIGGGQAPGGQAPGGQTPGGQTPDGQTPDGQTPDGQAPDGQAPDGQAPDGQAPDGQAPGGQAPGGQGAVGQGAGVPVLDFADTMYFDLGFLAFALITSEDLDPAYDGDLSDLITDFEDGVASLLITTTDDQLSGAIFGFGGQSDAPAGDMPMGDAPMGDAPMGDAPMGDTPMPAAPDGNGTTPPAGDGNGTTPPAGDGNGTTPPAGDGNGTTPPAGNGTGGGSAPPIDTPPAAPPTSGTPPTGSGATP